MPSAKETLSALFKRIANAIRTRDGTTEETDKIFPDDYPDRILAIEAGPEPIESGSTLPSQTGSTSVESSSSGLSITTTVSEDTTIKNGTQIKMEVPLDDFGTATSSDVLSGKTFTSASGFKQTGSIPSYSGRTIKPSTSLKTAVPAFTYTEGPVYVSGDANLLPSNIKSGVSIFGVAGELSSGTDTSDATATAADILSGKTAYVDGGKVTGTITTRSSSSLSASGRTVTVPAGYYPSQVSKSISTATQATPTISQSGTTITASSTQNAGYVSAGTKTATLTLPSAGSISGDLGVTGSASWSTSDPNRGSGKVSIKNVNQTAGYTDGYTNGQLSVTVPANRLLKGRTITPGTTQQKVGDAEDILYGAINVAGDANLIASNIKSGVSIFGVSGSYSGGALGYAYDVITMSSISATSMSFRYSTPAIDWSNKHVISYILLRTPSYKYYYIVFCNTYMVHSNYYGNTYGKFIDTSGGENNSSIGKLSWSYVGSNIYGCLLTKHSSLGANFPTDFNIDSAIVESFSIYQM